MPTEAAASPSLPAGNPLARVRVLVRRQFRSWGVADSSPLAEVLLIRDGHYAGHRWTAEGWRADWMAESGTVEFFDGQGQRRTSDGTANRQAA